MATAPNFNFIAAFNLFGASFCVVYSNPFTAIQGFLATATATTTTIETNQKNLDFESLYIHFIPTTSTIRGILSTATTPTPS